MRLTSVSVSLSDSLWVARLSRAGDFGVLWNQLQLQNSQKKQKLAPAAQSKRVSSAQRRGGPGPFRESA